MLKFLSYDVVFQEVPNEVTLAINISGCPNRCRGCHSPWLMEDAGEPLDEAALARLLREYGSAITCVCFMGGDAAPREVERLAAALRRANRHRLKVAWYSGRQTLPDGCSLQRFDFVKLGPYIAPLGGLDCATTNQRFYRIENGKMLDETERFRKEEKEKFVNPINSSTFAVTK
ncbi:MAG: anaerobic ribonucleoside-triphosphate reductase activating protein [Prevotellaceae bacterium]|jgi:anaerobic ribonucleoside-triphosphate reductase activating protein|nr:anaerobic ribonucleoside-triphosphate reductase activating protein [Prevotellaceae bacterium]